MDWHFLFTSWSLKRWSGLHGIYVGKPLGCEGFKQHYLDDLGMCGPKKGCNPLTLERLRPSSMSYCYY